MTITDAATIYSDAAAAVRRWDKKLRERHGVTFVQAVVITTIDQWAGSAWPRPVDVSRAMQMETQTLTGSIDRLARMGLVFRRRHETDRRSWRLVFTPAGYDKAEELREVEL